MDNKKMIFFVILIISFKINASEQFRDYQEFKEWKKQNQEERQKIAQSADIELSHKGIYTNEINLQKMSGSRIFPSEEYGYRDDSSHTFLTCQRNKLTGKYHCSNYSMFGLSKNQPFRTLTGDEAKLTFNLMKQAYAKIVDKYNQKPCGFFSAPPPTEPDAE